MDKREKVIKGLKYCIDYGKRIKDICNDVPCEGCPYCKYRDIRVGYGACIDRLHSDAIEILKAQEPRVMTLEELYDAEYVFFEDNRTGVLCLLPSGDDEYESYFTSRHCDIIQRWKDNYKKSWRCWTSRPSDSERGDTPWAE